MILYNFPARTGTDLSPELVARLASQYPNICGIKDTVDTISHTRKVIRAARAVNPEFTVFSGFDEYYLVNRVSGGNGVLSGLTNVEPRRSCACIALTRRATMLRPWRPPSAFRISWLSMTCAICLSLRLRLPLWSRACRIDQGVRACRAGNAGAGGAHSRAAGLRRQSGTGADRYCVEPDTGLGRAPKCIRYPLSGGTHRQDACPFLCLYVRNLWRREFARGFGINMRKLAQAAGNGKGSVAKTGRKAATPQVSDQIWLHD